MAGASGASSQFSQRIETGNRGRRSRGLVAQSLVAYRLVAYRIDCLAGRLARLEASCPSRRRRLSVDCSSGFAVFLEDNSPSPAIGEHETGLRRLGTALRSTVTGQRCSSEEFARGRTAGQRLNFLVEHIQGRTRLPRFFVSAGEPDCDFPGGPLGRLFSGGSLRTEAQGLSRHA